MGSVAHRLGCKVDNKATGSARFAALVNWCAAKNETRNLPLFLIPIEFEGAAEQ